MHVISADVEIVYRVAGEGPPVVLLHPFPVNHGLWTPLAPVLSPRYRLILPDLRGHGDSGVGDGPATMEKHAADLEKLCAAENLQQAVFAGVSIGGYVLFEFWRRHRERVKALVLADTRATADSEQGRADRLHSAEDVEHHGPSAFVESMLPKLLGESTRRNRPDLAEAVRKMMTRTSVRGIVAAQRGMAARPDSIPTLRTIDVPTLILVGEEDTLTTIADAELMRQNISGAQLVIIPNAGHFAVFEQPEAAGRALRTFLDAIHG